MRSLLPALLGFVLCACASSPSGPPDAGSTADAGGTADAGVASLPESPTLDQLVNYWDSKLCWTYACARHERQTPETCARAAASQEFPFDAFRRAQAQVAAGKATYDVAAGRRCGQLLTALDTSQDCFGSEAPNPSEAKAFFAAACGKLVLGLTPAGGACDVDSECDSGGVCKFDYSDAGGDCTGKCVVYLPAGADCSTRPTLCDPKTSYCDGSVCKARVLKQDGDFCVDAGECQSGKCFDYGCKEQSGLNGECATDDDCGPGLYCRALPPSSGRTGVCQVPAATGSACGYAVKCQGNQVCAGYSRRFMGGTKDGVCQDRPSGVGEACVPVADGYDFGESGCFADLTCNPETRKCEEAPANGSACATPGTRCGVDAWCDSSGICRAKKQDGETAAGSAECLDEYDSYQSKCYSSAERNRCNGI